MANNFTLQLLHHADFEGNTNAIEDAPRLAALFDYFDDSYVGSTLKLSGGDNWIPSPWYNSQLATQTSLVQALQSVYETYFGLPQGTLSGLTVSAGVFDQAITNLIGIQASTLGNHEFDQGADDIARIIEMTVSGEVDAASASEITNIGTLFPYITANLDFSNDANLSDTVSTVAQAIESISVAISGEASIDTSEEIAALINQDRIAPATYVEVNGELIGIVGATTQRLSSISSPGDVSVVDATNDDMALLAQQIQAQVDALLADHPSMNKVILIAHLQDYHNESALAELLSGVDIILSAGSDAIFADATDTIRDGHIVNETVYPLVHTGADGNPVLQINTDGQYQYLGRLVVEFDPNGVVLPDSVDIEASGAYAATDAMVSSLYGDRDPYAAGSTGALVSTLSSAIEGVIGEKLNNVAGYTEVYLNGARSSVRNQETNLGNLSADANLSTVQDYIALNMPTLQDVPLISLKNGGGIRADIGLPLGVSGPEAPVGGAVSQLDIETALAFNNGLALVQTTAAGLVMLLEHGIANAGTTNGRFPQIAGLSFSYDPTAQEGSRLVSLQLKNADGTPGKTIMSDGALVVSDSLPINIATLDFLATTDGDGYMFSEVSTSITPLVTDEVKTFSTPYSEQNAMYEYMQSNYGSLQAAYSQTDVGAASDSRIQDLSVRTDGVFDDSWQANSSAQSASGGIGTDIVTYNGNLADYSIVRDHANTIVTSLSNSNDVDVWTNIERLQFSDQSYTVQYDNTLLTIASLYEVILGRQADLTGFQFWSNAHQNGADLGGTANAFLSSSEFERQTGITFTGLSNDDKIDALYEVLLKRTADVQGKSYWVNQLESGASLASVTEGFVLSSEMQANVSDAQSWDFVV